MVNYTSENIIKPTHTHTRLPLLRPNACRADALAELQQDDTFAFSALLWLYQRQTRAEVIHKSSFFRNGEGFNIIDARTLTPLAQRGKRDALSIEELSFVKQTVAKYIGQIVRAARGSE